MKFNLKTELLFCLTILFLSTLIYSCGASSTVRYDRNKENKKDTEDASGEKIYDENFDVIPYRTNINIKEKSSGDVNNPELKPWYSYEEKDTIAAEEKAIIGTRNGFRVQVLATDNLQDADSLKTELSLKVTQKNIYVIFDPPFYKVEVGDFITMSDAKDLNFKLTQMGYSESRVIASTINIFE